MCAHWLKMSPVSSVSCAKHAHPRMFHPSSLLFPHGHFDVHFPTSPAPSPAMPFPRSKLTPTSPRRATPPGGPESGFLAYLTPSTDSKRIHQQSNERSLSRVPEAMNRLIPRYAGGGTHPTQEENSSATQHAWAQQTWHLVYPGCETCEVLS